MNAGQLYPNPWSFTNIKIETKIKNKCINCKSSNKKKYVEILIIAHYSEKPLLIFEEMNSGKICHIML